MPAAAVIGGVASMFGADRAASAQNKATDAAMQAQQDNLGFQKEQYRDWQNTYQPVEQDLASKAMKAGSTGELNNNMGMAYADAMQANSAQQGALQRGMARMGVNAASGKYAGLMNENAIQGAATGAQAMNSARVQTKQNAFNEEAQVAQLGRNIPGQVGQNMNGAAMGLLYSGAQQGNMAATQGKAIGGLVNGVNQMGQDQGWWGGNHTWGNNQSNQALGGYDFQAPGAGATESAPELNYSYGGFSE